MVSEWEITQSTSKRIWKMANMAFIEFFDFKMYVLQCSIWNIVRCLFDTLCFRNWLILAWKTKDDKHTHTHSHTYYYICDVSTLCLCTWFVFVGLTLDFTCRIWCIVCLFNPCHRVPLYMYYVTIIHKHSKRHRNMCASFKLSCPLSLSLNLGHTLQLERFSLFRCASQLCWNGMIQISFYRNRCLFVWVSKIHNGNEIFSGLFFLLLLASFSDLLFFHLWIISRCLALDVRQWCISVSSVRIISIEQHFFLFDSWQT